MAFDLIIRNGTIFTPHGWEQSDIAIKNGKIAAIGTITENAAQTISATGQHVLPGLIDTQVHFREPGNEHKEDLESGTRGAVLGGVTGVFEMPNTKPSTTTPEALADKISRMQNRTWSNYAFYVGGTPDKNANWHELENLPGCCGIKIFMGSSTGNLLVAEDDAIRNILKNSKRRIAVHAEDEFRLKERFHIAQEGAHPKFHPIWRDEETALRATKRLIAIARETNHPVHVLHITTKEEMEFLSHHKDIASVETLPQHLTLDDTMYETLGTRLQMNPPVRGKTHQAALWRAIHDGTVDVLGSDHAPHTLEEKAKPYPQSPSGMPGVQTIVPVMLNHINNGKLTLERLIELMVTNPVKLFGIKNKGQLAENFDADITIVDMNKTVKITDEMMANKSGWTPYDGMEFTGFPTHTIIHGKVVMQNGKLQNQGAGKPYQF